MKSLQADKQMLMALLSANVKVIHGEDYLELIGKERKAFCFDANDCPDLFPALAVLAAKTEGISEILGLNRLQIKESDRGVAIQQELSKMGVFVDLLYEEDKMLIHGKNTLNSGSFSSHHDHRIAMMIGVLTCFMNEASELDNSQAVEKSYPDFWHHRSSLFH